MKFRTLTYIIVIVLLLLFPFATMVADGPTRTPNLAPPFTLAAGLACSFPLHGEYVINQEIVKTFPPDPNAT